MTAVPSPRVRRVYNAEQWNRIVQGFPHHHVKQGFEWGELAAEHGWRPARFAAFLDTDPVAACAVLCYAFPATGSVLYAPRGPLFRPDVPAGLDRVLEALRGLGERTGAIFVRMSPAVPVDDAASIAALDRSELVILPEAWTTWNTPRSTQVLHLTRDAREPGRGVRHRVRDSAAAPPRPGLVTVASDRDDDLVAFHTLMADTALATGVPVCDVSWYRALVRHYSPEHAVTLLVAREHDTMVGGLLAIRFGRRSYVLDLSVRDGVAEPARSRVLRALAWEHVRRAHSEGCELVDVAGIDAFQAGLGCSRETFVPLRDIVLRPALYRLFRACEVRRLPPLWWLVARPPASPARVVDAAA